MTMGRALRNREETSFPLELFPPAFGHHDWKLFNTNRPGFWEAKSFTSAPISSLYARENTGENKDTINSIKESIR